VQLGDVPGLRVAADPPFGETNFQSFWIVLPDDFPVARDDLLARMKARGISARRGFMAAHLEPAFPNGPYGDLAVTERLTRQALILPLFHQLTEDEQDRVIALVRHAD
jgi:perosamine synthetase